MQLKELLTEKRAVSPVIGVILMVAITVILAAVIGTFVLGLGDQVESSPQAGVSFSENSGSVTMTWVSEGNVDTSKGLNVTKCDGTLDFSLKAVGQTVKDSTCSNGDTVTVTGNTTGGANGVVSQYTYEN